MKSMSAVVVIGAATLTVTGLAWLPIAQAHQSKGFPTVYSVDEGRPVVGTNGLLTQTGTLRAADGTRGTFKATFRLKLSPGGTVRCGGHVYHGPFTEDLKNSGSGSFSIAGWGVAAFTTTRTVAVFRLSGPSPPICIADVGTYRFTSGRLKGKQGTYTELATYLLTSLARDTLVFH